MPVQLNYVEIGFEMTVDPFSPRKQGQYIRGFIKLLEHMKEHPFIETENIQIKRAVLILNRWGKSFFIPTSYFHSISLFKDRNILEIIIGIYPYGTVKVTIFMNSEGTIHHTTLESLEYFFTVNYLALDLEIRAKPIPKKRLSWWKT